VLSAGCSCLVLGAWCRVLCRVLVPSARAECPCRVPVPSSTEPGTAPGTAPGTRHTTPGTSTQHPALERPALERPYNLPRVPALRAVPRAPACDDSRDCRGHRLKRDRSTQTGVDGRGGLDASRLAADAIVALGAARCGRSRSGAWAPWPGLDPGAQTVLANAAKTGDRVLRKIAAARR